MVLFGWLVLLVMSLLTTFWVLAGMFVSHGFGGKVEKGFLILAIIPAVLWYITLNNMPFVMVSAG